MVDTADFSEWIKRDPAPSLQDLVAKSGNFSLILSQGWAEYDALVAAWQERRKLRSTIQVPTI
jgi:hypothetical protein